MTNKIKNSNLDEDIVTGAIELSSGAAEGDYVLFYDASAGVLKKITQSNLLNLPTISSVSPTNALSGDGTGNYTFVITGQGFTTGIVASLVNSSGTTVSFDSQTRDSSTQITGVIAKSSLPGSGEPYDVKVVATNGLQNTLENQINIDQQPAYSTSAGSLGTFDDTSRTINLTVQAADPESGGDITYTLESGSLPSGLSLTSTSSGAVISGTADAVASETTSTFTIRAADVNSNTSDREFTITIQPPVVEIFNSSGTFTVPSGITQVDVLIVAGGGGGGASIGGGGGAGGLVFAPNYPVTPGGTISVTVGNGGTGDNTPTPSTGDYGGSGQNSVFGTITAVGGGGGGSRRCGNWLSWPGNSGGSGGGGSSGDSSSNSSGGSGTQGPSGGYTGYGNNGGGGRIRFPHGTGGGGGAGAAAQPADNPTGASNGGIGRAYTIADGSSPVYYAGGGAGVTCHSCATIIQPGGQGGGGATQYNVTQDDGTANRGGGGGGGSFPSSIPDNKAGDGGKGVVIVRWS